MDKRYKILIVFLLAWAVGITLFVKSRTKNKELTIPEKILESKELGQPSPNQEALTSIKPKAETTTMTKQKAASNKEPVPNNAMSDRREIAEKKEAEKEEKSRPAASGIKVTFVELGSVKCIPCKMMQPIMKEIEEEYKGEVKVVFYDIWTPEGKPYIQTYQVQAIPTQVFLDENGKEYFRHTGFFPKDELIKVLKMKGVNQ